jgi:hypothetical protein
VFMFICHWNVSAFPPSPTSKSRSPAAPGLFPGDARDWYVALDYQHLFVFLETGSCYVTQAGLELLSWYNKRNLTIL